MKPYPRVPPRLDWIFPDSPVFFVTFCTHNRKPILANESVHSVFRKFSEQASQQHNIAVGRYVIMPDHIHLFVCGPADDFVLGRWIGSLKRAIARSISGSRVAGPFWQRGFFDHVLRNDESYGQKWDYVFENPVRAGLVSNAEEWPYAGEIVLIDRA